MMTLYGIPNCDSCRKARKWLDNNDMNYRFHDLREDGIDKKRIGTWLESAGLKTVLNTRSATWRGLSAKERDNLNDARAVDLMVQNPTLVKRPVLESGRVILVGFSPDKYAALLH